MENLPFFSLFFLRKRRRWAFFKNTLQALDPPTFRIFRFNFGYGNDFQQQFLLKNSEISTLLGSSPVLRHNNACGIDFTLFQSGKFTCRTVVLLAAQFFFRFLRWLSIRETIDSVAFSMMFKTNNNIKIQHSSHIVTSKSDQHGFDSTAQQVYLLHSCFYCF